MIHVILKNILFAKPFKDCKAAIVDLILSSHDLSTDRDGELANPLRIWKVF